MANRVKGFAVTLEHPIDAESAKRVRDALLLIQTVVSVQEIEVDSIGDFLVEQRLKTSLREKLYSFMKENL